MALFNLFGPPNIEKLKEKRNINGLIKALDSKNEPSVRCDAAKALGEIGDVLAVDALLINLKDVIWDVRGSAAAALGNIGDKRVVEPLIELLEDKKAAVRADAAEALGKINDDRAVIPLINRLTDPDGLSRSKAIESLGKFMSKEAIEPLIVVLEDTDLQVHNSAVLALAAIGEPSIKPLLSTLERNVDDGRFIKIMNATNAVLVKIGNAAVEPLIQGLTNENMNIRLWAACGSGRLGDPRAVEPLLNFLRSENFDFRNNAAMALQESGWTADEGESGAFYWAALEKWDQCEKIGKDAIPALLNVLDHGKTFEKEVIKTLGKIGDERSTRLLVEMLEKATSSSQKNDIASALLGIGDVQAVIPLINAAQDEEKIVPIVTDLMNKIGKPAIQNLLNDIANGDVVSWHKIVEEAKRLDWKLDVEPAGLAYLIYKSDWKACAKFGESAVEPLIYALKDKDTDVCSAAAKALGEIGDVRAVEPLIEALDLEKMRDYKNYKSYYLACMSAAEALGKIKDKEGRAIKRLSEALADKYSHDVQTSAAKALKQLDDIRALEFLRNILNTKYPNSYAESQAYHGISETKKLFDILGKKAIRSLKDKDFASVEERHYSETELPSFLTGNWYCKIEKEISKLLLNRTNYKWIIPKLPTELQSGWAGSYVVLGDNLLEFTSEIGGTKSYIIDKISDNMMLWHNENAKMYFLRLY